MNYSNKIKQNVKNIFGYKTNRKIIVFSIDDYGNIRNFSRESRRELDEIGLKNIDRFDQYDTLETSQDLSILFEVLNKFRDVNNNPPVFSAFAVPVNINFEKMAEQDYSEYHYELLPATLRKLSEINPKSYSGAWDLWKEGMDKKLIHPEFHGREHFNLKVFKEKLAKRDFELITSLKNQSLTSISQSGYDTISYTAAFEFDKFEENQMFESIIKDGLKQFENVFGYRARHFNPPGGREHPVNHKFLKDGGIEYIDTPLIKKEHQGNGKYKHIFNYSGKKNKHNQIFQVRNCVFEPTHNRGFDWVNYTFKQVETAFRWHNPAIIGTHRVNFCGHIDPENRKKGLETLKKLLQRIVKAYPDVEFITSTELGDLMRAGKKNSRTMKQTVIYKFDKERDVIPDATLPENYSLKWWRPSPTHFIPPRKSKKYFMYWLFHYLRVFKNRDYASLFLYDNQTLITSFLIVPAHFKWPFMGNIDLQFTYVMTHKQYRGQGLAARSLQFAMEKFYRPERSFWYVTDNENKASMRVAEKLGFSRFNV